MHFRSEPGGFGLSDIGTIEDFLVKAHNSGMTVKLANVWFYDTAENDIGECVLAIKPENMQFIPG